MNKAGQREYLEKNCCFLRTLIRKMPISCSRFSKQIVSCSTSRSRSLAYLSILSPHRSARLFCKLFILSRVENTPSLRAPPCFKLCSMKKKKKRKDTKNTTRREKIFDKQNRTQVPDINVKHACVGSMSDIRIIVLLLKNFFLQLLN